MPPSEEIEKQPPLMSAGASLPSRAFFASSPISCEICSTPFLSAVLDHRHHQAVRRVGGEADVEVLLQDELVAVEDGVELGELLQRGDRRP